jgi:hypothetical protein
VPLTVGILTIGSLLWDDRRRPWRDARLDMASIATHRILSMTCMNTVTATTAAPTP